MAQVVKEGKPDLFITFTSNPKWPDINNNLPPYQDALYRPDLEARVFKLKLKELMRDIMQERIFGIVTSYIYVIEYPDRTDRSNYLSWASGQGGESTIVLYCNQ